MMRDQNGEVAALIKVVTLETGFVFDGGMLGIVNTVQKTGEIWVYVPFGLQRITISHQRFGLLRDYFFDIPIERGRTYEMKLKTGVGRTIIEDATSVKRVQFTVKPQNALITIDEIMYPLDANGSITQFLAKGTHIYRVDAPGYFSENSEFRVDDTDVDISVTLESLEGMVRLECPMTDAELYLNNQYLGKGTWTGTLAPAIYQVEARHDGYTSSITSFTLQVQEERVIVIAAPEPIYGGLILSSNPTGAIAFVDGVRLGETPWTINNLVIGEHSVEFRKEGWNNYNTQVVVEENKAVAVNATLTNDFAIVIHSSPEGAALHINGQPRGITPANLRLSPGTYDIHAVKEGYETYHRKEYLDGTLGEKQIVMLGHRFLRDQLYFDGFMQFAGVKAAGGHFGWYSKGVTFELGITKPLVEKRNVYWVYQEYNPASDDTLKSICSFSAVISASLGYGIKLGRYVRVTPQLGVSGSLMTDEVKSGMTATLPGTVRSEGHEQSSYILDLTAAIRMEVSPIRHVSLFVAPTYNRLLKMGELAATYDNYTSLIDEWHKDWAVRAGMVFYFGL
jgi:hypothetical protein